jgi:hypothetical protein
MVCYCFFDDEQDSDLAGDGYRTDGGSVSRFCAHLHRFRLAFAKSMSSGLLRRQNLLRDLKENRSRVAPDCEN